MNRSAETGESPRTDPHVYGQLTFDRVLKQSNREKNTLFRKSEQLDIHTQKSEIVHLLHIIYKHVLKMEMALYIKS